MKKTCFVTALCLTSALFASTIHATEQPAMEKDLKQLESMMDLVGAQSKAMDTYRQEQLKIEQYRAMLKELRWIIERNMAFIKDFQVNADCMAVRKALEILAADKQELLSKKEKMAAEARAFGSGSTPALAELYHQNQEELNQALQGIEDVQTRLAASQCNTTSN